jgi:hypothetical protein
MKGKTGQHGRPPVWSSAAEKHRAYRARKAEKVALLEELLHVVRNADHEDRQLQQEVNHGDDAAVLRALIGYYQARHWNFTGWGIGKAEKP